MPCFDQPDLRATLDLTVEAPRTWTVVTASPESSVRDTASGKQWIFCAHGPHFHLLVFRSTVDLLKCGPINSKIFPYA